MIQLPHHSHVAILTTVPCGSMPLMRIRLGWELSLFVCCRVGDRIGEINVSLLPP